MGKLIYILFKSLGVKGVVWMATSLWFLAGQSGMVLAVALVSAVTIHELGHALFCHLQGITDTKMLILPIGGKVSFKAAGVPPQKMAWITLGGPLLGGVVAIVAYFFYLRHESPQLLLFVFAGFMLNLINLVPIFPLDGGRLAEHLHKGVLFLGIPCYAWLYFRSHSPLVILIGVFFLIRLLTPAPKQLVCKECQTENDPIVVKCQGCKFPLRLTRFERLGLGVSYAALLAVMIIGVTLTSGKVEQSRRAVEKKSNTPKHFKSQNDFKWPEHWSK